MQPFLLRKGQKDNAICTIGLFQNDVGLKYDTFWNYATDCNRMVRHFNKGIVEDGSEEHAVELLYHYGPMAPSIFGITLKSHRYPVDDRPRLTATAWLIIQTATYIALCSGYFLMLPTCITKISLRTSACVFVVLSHAGCSCNEACDQGASMVPLAQWHGTERMRNELRVFIFKLRMNHIELPRNKLKDGESPIWIFPEPITIMTSRVTDSDTNTMLLIGHYHELQRWRHNLLVAHATSESSSWNVFLVQAYTSYTLRRAQGRRRVCRWHSSILLANSPQRFPAPLQPPWKSFETATRWSSNDTPFCIPPCPRSSQHRCPALTSRLCAQLTNQHQRRRPI